MDTPVLTDVDEAPVATVDGHQILVSVIINNHRITIAKRNLEQFDAQDPYFFDSDYTIAGSTGFLLWEANWLVMRLLRSAFSPSEGQPIDSSHAPALLGPARHKPTVHLGRLLAGHRVLDLGSGTGLAGLSAAACGAHVLLTDLASVCEGTLRANMQRNCRTVPLGEAAASCRAQCSEEKSQQEHQGMAPGPCDGPWAGAVGIGQGSAAVMALDWTEPLEPQIQAGGNDPRDADFILAVDTIWLLDIFHAFLDIILAVLSHDRASAAAITTTTATPLQPGNEKTGSAQCQRACFLAFVERADADSKLFVPKEAVDQELRNRGLAVDTILAEDVDVDGVARPGRVLRVTLANH